MVSPRRLLVLITKISDHGGIETYSRRFLDELGIYCNDCSIDVILLRNHESAGIASNTGDFDTIWCCGGGSRLKTILLYVFRLFYCCIFRRPHLIVSNHIDMLRPYYFMHHVMRIPYVLVVYGVDAWRMSRFSRQIVAHSRRLASISEFTTKRVKAQLASAFPISYLPPTVDANRFQPGSPTVDVRAMHDLSANDCVVLCVCRFAASEQYKGYDCLLRAWPSVLKRIKNARLLFVGKGNDLLRAKKLADAEGLNETVRFAGFVEADLLPDYYRACDVFAMPSVGEGFGIVFLEALACGKPVIAGDKDGSADPLLKGELGILINPLSVDELTEALIKAMTGDGPKHLYDSLWLRNHVIAAYGPQIFKERMRLFIDQSMEP